MEEEKQLLILFRGEKIRLPLFHGLTVWDVKQALIEATSNADSKLLLPTDIKVLWKGKILPNDGVLDTLLETAATKSKKSKNMYSLVATGMSSTEASRLQQQNESVQRQTARLIKDDLSAASRQRLQQLSAAGQRMMRLRQQQQRKGSPVFYGCGSIETLPELPNEQGARLSKDPGIL